MKKIIITGNLGYIGSMLGAHLKARYSDIVLVGIDAGYFSQCLTCPDNRVDNYYDVQHYADVRDIDYKIFDNAFSVIHLAAISNDPMGNKFSHVTEEVNRKAAVDITRYCIKQDINSIVFASSCSMYGTNSGFPKTEKDSVNPLTAYAKSKIGAENDLNDINNNCSIITSLRFSTACGYSARTRLDLVLNDFVASAIATKKIIISSDGSPWRPLIDVSDMCKAIDWAIFRSDEYNHIKSVNIGLNEYNYQVKDIALKVKEFIGDVEIIINENAIPDKRSYQVNFDLFSKIAPAYIPTINLNNSINDLISGLKKQKSVDENFRNSMFIRLKKLEDLMENKIIDDTLRYESNSNRI